MENREDLRSILPFLPLVLRSSSSPLFWPSQAVELLKSMAGAGPDHSRIDSGHDLFLLISDLRRALSLSDQPVASHTRDGYIFFFDELISETEASIWFEEVIPAMAHLLLRLPSLLETHYQNADDIATDGRDRVKTGLRLLASQEAGIVFLSQELIGALLACAFFCLFPVTDRGAKNLPMINFDYLFAILYDSYRKKHENKIQCIIHYFKRICSNMPGGFVSFERKVLPWEHCSRHISYPNSDFWSNSVIPLCQFEVHHSGLIEDQSRCSLEVDFANKYIGGGALRSGCVQEEIRFMISPELIAGMLFLPSMADNEAIEIVGVERFSDYSGYASTFRFAGDYEDIKEVDVFGRHKTSIIAIDAVFSPKMSQYKQEFLLREINKAFCGFFDRSKNHHHERLFQESGCCRAKPEKTGCEVESTSNAFENYKGRSVNEMLKNSGETENQCLNRDGNIGIATGNWGCGAFGGDPQMKSIIQWLAASQALRPFISYYTFGTEALQHLDQVSEWILSHKWTVGDLWSMLMEYSSQRSKRQTNVGFFAWLLPSLLDPET